MSKQKKREGWSQWQTPSDKEQIVLAKILLPYIKILSPEIVKVIVDSNNKNRNRWTCEFEKLGIRPDIYLWENSPVTFPGIRRHSGIKEVASFGSTAKTIRGDNALVLDDNSYPKELWSFALRNCKYDKTNPPNFSLAHIVDHKDYKTRSNEELKDFKQSEQKHLFAGLYTSCANTVWIPNLLLKPTDSKGKLRLLMIQIVAKYYSSVCNILPYNLSFNLDNIEDEWRIENFPEPTLVGNVANATNFMQYRNNLIDDTIKNYH
jgi:hypothetical protein